MTWAVGPWGLEAARLLQPTGHRDQEGTEIGNRGANVTWREFLFLKWKRRAQFKCHGEIPGERETKEGRFRGGAGASGGPGRVGGWWAQGVGPQEFLFLLREEVQ